MSLVVTEWRCQDRDRFLGLERFRLTVHYTTWSRLIVRAAPLQNTDRCASRPLGVVCSGFRGQLASRECGAEMCGRGQVRKLSRRPRTHADACSRNFTFSCGRGREHLLLRSSIARYAYTINVDLNFRLFEQNNVLFGSCTASDIPIFVCTVLLQ